MSALAAVVKLSHLPGLEEFVRDLVWKSVGIGCRGKRFGRQHTRSLMMSMLPGRGSGIHGNNHLRTERPDVSHQSPESFLVIPFPQSRGQAFRVSPVQLIEEKNMPD